MKTQNIERRCYRTGKYTVCRRVPASFNPEVLQAVAVLGLNSPNAILKWLIDAAFTDRGYY